MFKWSENYDYFFDDLWKRCNLYDKLFVIVYKQKKFNKKIYLNLPYLKEMRSTKGNIYIVKQISK